MRLKRPFRGHIDSPGDADPTSDESSEDGMSSDDSIELDVGPTQTGPNTISGQKYGIGAELLARMGHKPGSGLGRDGSGMVDPIEVAKRQNRAGLGMEVPEVLTPTTDTDADSHTSKKDEKTQNSKVARLKTIKNELDLIKEQQATLTQAVDIINAEGEELEVLDFYERFGSLTVWHTERLYEVVAAIIRSRIPRAGAFQWLLQHPDLLFAANEVLPENEWAKILAVRWLQNGTDDLPQLLNEWTLGHFHGFGAAGQYLSQMFCDKDIVQKAVAQGPEFLSKLLSTLPDVGYLVPEIKGAIQSYSLRDQVTVLSCVKLESDVIARMVPSNADLNTQSEALTAYSTVLSKDVLSDVLQKTRIRELWLEELSVRLQQPRQEVAASVASWWLQWRPFFAMFTDVSVDPWLLSGLDMINSTLDGTQDHQFSRPSQPSRKVSSTFKDVLDHVCYMNDFSLAPTDTGYTVKGPRKELEVIVDNDVLLVRKSQSLIPVSLDTILAYLAK